MSRRRLAAAVLGLAFVAACGVPLEATPRIVEPSQVPNRLLDTKAPRPSDATPAGRAVAYFVAEDRIVPVRRADLQGSTQQKLRRTIRLLLEGPTQREQSRGLGTAIPTDLDLRVAAVRGTTVTIDLAGTLRNSPSEDRTLAVAQIVLTTTAVVGIDAVQLTQQGKTIEAPLVDGSLTSDPLISTDYEALLDAATPGTPTR